VKEPETQPVPGYWEKWREDVVSSKEMFLALQVMDVATDGIVVTDMHDRILEANRMMLKISGYKKEELIGEPVSKLIEVEERFGTLLRLQKVVAGDAVKKTESKIITKRGREIPIKLHARIIEDEKGEPKFTVWAFKNIAELKRAEEAERRQLLRTLNLLHQAWKSEKRRPVPAPRRVVHDEEVFRILKQQLTSRKRISDIVESYKELFKPLIKARGGVPKLHKKTVRPETRP
jgi:PAS domain S-box-containing protein